MDSPHFSAVEYQRYLLHFSAHCLMLLSVGVGGGGGGGFPGFFRTF
jgi:hypothetical protein